MKKVFTLITLLAIVLLQSNQANAQSGDTEPPSDVANVRVTPAVESLILEWDPSEDNEAVVGYKIYYGPRSVSKDGGLYKEEIETDNTELTYTIEDLEAGKPYYAAITAVDAAGNESFNYSLEVSGTPEEAEEIEEEEEEEENEFPMAIIEANVTSGDVPLEIEFDGTASVYSGGDITAYAWDFDGDGEVDSSSPTPTYTYLESGVFDAGLEITTDNEKTASTVVSVVAWEEEVVEEEEIVEEIEEEVVEEEEVEMIYPIEATNLEASYLAIEEGYNVIFSWEEGEGADVNNSKYILEVAGETYELAAGETSYTVSLNGGQDYTATLYAETAEGERSAGAVVEFTLPELSDTGAALFIPFGVAAAGAYLGRKRK